MNTTRSLAAIMATADLLPEPARSAARAELWALQRLTPTSQADALPRWATAASTWPAAS